jgi:uncharacterized integral membrane protein (TIGR00698 family)
MSDPPAGTSPRDSRPVFRGLSEDWTSALVGILVLLFALGGSLATRPSRLSWNSAADVAKSVEWNSPVAGWIGKPGTWTDAPLDAFREKPQPADDDTAPATHGRLKLGPLAGAFVVTLLVGLLAIKLRGYAAAPFLAAFPPLFALATLSYVLAAQTVVNYYNLEYVLWALLVGLVISNTVGTPRWLRPAVAGELFIKIGLVLLGAEVLFGRLLALGIPGIFVSWIVTPIVLIATYLFGQRVLKISSKSLNMVISADMSVCGVSAAIATAAACRAKKEELTLAIGLSLGFTVIMMVLLPPVVLMLGLDPVVGGAWIGGTIDATGAVAAAGEALGSAGSETAVTVKMIQNILIGVIAFGVAVYWTRWVDPAESESTPSTENATTAAPAVGAGEIWKRFPKFVLGFLGASILCSLLFAASAFGEQWVTSATKGMTTPLRGWLFCLAFVCIGLDTNIRQLLPYFRTGKPMLLYVCGQSLNLLLTLIMAYLMFGIVFRPA